VSIPPYVLSTFVGAVLWSSTSIVSKASRARDMAATINEEILLLEAGEAFRRLLVSAFVCYIFAKRINHSSHQSVFQSTRGCPSQS
jgi:hypothetical protein